MREVSTGFAVPGPPAPAPDHQAFHSLALLGIEAGEILWGHACAGGAAMPPATG